MVQQYHRISFTDAAALTKNYRDNMSAGDLKGGAFYAGDIRTILNQPDCIGLRYYYGLDSANKQVLVLCGVDINGNDLVGTGNICCEMAMPCPDTCGVNSVLNSDT